MNPKGIALIIFLLLFFLAISLWSTGTSGLKSVKFFPRVFDIFRPSRYLPRFPVMPSQQPFIIPQQQPVYERTP